MVGAYSNTTRCSYKLHFKPGERRTYAEQPSKCAHWTPCSSKRNGRVINMCASVKTTHHSLRTDWNVLVYVRNIGATPEWHEWILTRKEAMERVAWISKPAFFFWGGRWFLCAAVTVLCEMAARGPVLAFQNAGNQHHHQHHHHRTASANYHRRY